MYPPHPATIGAPGVIEANWVTRLEAAALTVQVGMPALARKNVANGPIVATTLTPAAVAGIVVAVWEPWQLEVSPIAPTVVPLELTKLAPAVGACPARFDVTYWQIAVATVESDAEVATLNARAPASAAASAAFCAVRR